MLTCRYGDNLKGSPMLSSFSRFIPGACKNSTIDQEEEHRAKEGRREEWKGPSEGIKIEM